MVILLAAACATGCAASSRAAGGRPCAGCRRCFRFSATCRENTILLRSDAFNRCSGVSRARRAALSRRSGHRRRFRPRRPIAANGRMALRSWRGSGHQRSVVANCSRCGSYAEQTGMDARPDRLRPMIAERASTHARPRRISGPVLRHGCLRIRLAVTADADRDTSNLAVAGSPSRSRGCGVTTLARTADPPVRARLRPAGFCCRGAGSHLPSCGRYWMRQFHSGPHSPAHPYDRNRIHKYQWVIFFHNSKIIIDQRLAFSLVSIIDFGVGWWRMALCHHSTRPDSTREAGA